jgi:hypothetical protein
MSSVKKSVPTITARLRGGLGNQIFIYAAARRVAQNCSGLVSLDLVSGFERDFLYKRIPLLTLCKIDAIGARAGVLQRGVLGRVSRELQRIGNRGLPVRLRSYIYEPHTPSGYKLSDLRIVRKNVVIDGYWQNERYEGEILNRLRSELYPQESLKIDGSPHYSKIKGCDAIGVHVRTYRDVVDGVNRPLDELVIAAKTGAENIAAKLEKPQIFLFSDAPTLVHPRFQTRYPVTYMNNSGPVGNLDGFNDFFLLRCCKHFVISRSSFSRWAADLGKNEQSMIFDASKNVWENR